MLKYKERVDTAIQALADPTRRVIVERLSTGEASVSDIAKPFDVSLSAVHQQLAILERAGLVASRKQGRVRTCRIEPKGFAAVERWLGERRTAWQAKLDRLDDYLKEGEGR